MKTSMPRWEMCSAAVEHISASAPPSIAQPRRCEINTLSRRDFLKMTGLTSGGLVLAVYLQGCLPGTGTPTIIPVTPGASATPQPPFAWEPNIYLKLDRDGI